MPRHKINSRDYIEFTCPKADAALKDALRSLEAVERRYEEIPLSAIKAISQIINDLHDVNHTLRDELREAMARMAEDYSEALDEREDFEEESAKLDNQLYILRQEYDDLEKRLAVTA